MRSPGSRVWIDVLRLRPDPPAPDAALRRAAGIELPALVVTAEAGPQALQRLRDAGLPWLPKPVQPMRLRSWLQQVAHAVTPAAVPTAGD